MKKSVRVLSGVLIGIMLFSIAWAQESVAVLNVMHIEKSGYHPDEMKMIADLFQELAGIEVHIDYFSYDDAHAELSEMAAIYDIMAVDHIWLAELVSKNLLTPLDEYMDRSLQRDIPSTVRDAFRYQNRIWAFPFLVNFQLLFYNKKMLTQAGFEKPPGALEAMVEQMKRLKHNGIVEYPWTDAWGQGEALVTEFIWLTGAFGGELFDKDGTPLFDQDPGIRALEFMVMLLNEQLANPAILKNDEIAAKDDFLGGRAAFTSNWLFLQGLLNDPTVSDIVGQGKIGLLPSSKSVAAKTTSVSAFQGIALTATSADKETAWKWIRFITSPLVQRAYLFEMPIWESIQTSQDANMMDATLKTKREQLANVHHRPNLVNYSQVLSILQKYLRSALQGKMDPADALRQAKTEIENIK